MHKALCLSNQHSYSLASAWQQRDRLIAKHNLDSEAILQHFYLTGTEIANSKKQKAKSKNTNKNIGYLQKKP